MPRSGEFMDNVQKRLVELEGKELEGEEAREWAKLVTIEYEEHEKQEERDRRNVQAVPTDMERETTQV